MNNDFFSGLSLVVKGLIDASRRASFCLGFGAAGFGIVLVFARKYELIYVESTLVSIAAFFILARLGKALDDYLSNRKEGIYHNIAYKNNELPIKTQQRIELIRAKLTVLQAEFGVFDNKEMLPIFEMLADLSTKPHTIRELNKKLNKLDVALGMIKKAEKMLERNIKPTNLPETFL